jgi:hypothetical protein
MVSITKATAFPLLPILHRSFPDITSYKVDNHIVQSSAEGFCISCENNSDTHSDNEYLFVKCVEASNYSNRPWADLRRALLYSRTEARFYSEILPLLRENSSSRWTVAPTCHLSEYYLDDLIEEGEATAAKVGDESDDPVYDEQDCSILQGKGGNLILESLNGSYYQSSPLNVKQARQCLSAAAKFHATAFENKEILDKVSDRLCQYGGSYHLKNRNPKELNAIRKTWGDIVSNIKDAAPPHYFERDGIKNLDERISTVAQYVSDELSPSCNDKFATIVHGDFKAMNIFLPLTDEEEDLQPILIDFASVGVGLGVSDIAMHIPHALHPNDLKDGEEERLVEHYYNALQEALPKSKQGIYLLEDVKRHYRFASVDYFRFIMGRMWKGLSLDVFEKRKSLKNFAEFNRTLEAALAFIDKVDKYLIQIEEEMASSKKNSVLAK